MPDQISREEIDRNRDRAIEEMVRKGASDEDLQKTCEEFKKDDEDMGWDK
ncbi:MAG TPA: hypothetical protein VHR66_09320 [Gemmataceae bacterium]|jgi:DNA-binding transcriptional regulator YhcF (GntR family)|nr:hypothetical protein [Gemmataceae bacterium]